MKRPDDFISQMDPIPKAYIEFLEGVLLRVIQAVLPNVKKFDPADVASVVLFIEQEQKPAPEPTTPWYKTWLAWVAIAVLVGFMLIREYLGE
ncbi:hypothetical protein LCGC14_1906380 [marine sediment metagenome]|uniref:Uncharacterized protein n=1 Tax=marine sediment metagenome TaxID=412755 RepID=A0A0F9FV38_9ZZZZ